MTRNTFSANGNCTRTQDHLSPIAQIRNARHARPARAGDGAQDAHLPANADSGAINAVAVKTDASAVYSTDIPLLGQLISWVHSRTRDRYLKEPEVLTIVGRSKAAMRKDVSLGLFPAQVRLGLKSTGWRESEVMGWVEATTILSRVANPGFGMKEFVAALMASRIPMR